MTAFCRTLYMLRTTSYGFVPTLYSHHDGNLRHTAEQLKHVYFGERHRAEAFLQRRLLASAGHQLFQVTVYLHYGSPSTYSIRLAIAIRQSTKKFRIELCRTSLPYA